MMALQVLRKNIETHGTKSSETAYFNSRYVLQHNTKCPCCEKNFQRINTQLSNVGVITGVYDEVGDAYIAYMLCTKCTSGFGITRLRPHLALIGTLTRELEEVLAFEERIKPTLVNALKTVEPV